MLHSVTGDAVDLFAVEFTSRECMLGGRSYPLGFFAAEALDRIPDMVELQSSVASMKEALEVVNGPVIFGLNAGHRGDSITLPMNAPVRLSAKGTDICFQMI